MSPLESPLVHHSNWWAAWLEQAGSGLRERPEHPALESMAFHHVAYSVNPKLLSGRNLLSANPLQSKAKEWERGSALYISMLSKGITPKLVSTETMRHHHLLNSLTDAVESAGICSNFPKALFRPNKEFLSVKEFRSQSLQKIFNFSLLLHWSSTAMITAVSICTLWTLYQHREVNTCDDCCLEEIWQRWRADLC